MKARVKATGEIVDVSRLGDKYIMTDHLHIIAFNRDELDFEITNEPDYWEKLKHQAVISAMQGLLSNSAYLENFVKYSVEGDNFVRVVSTNAIDYATALINKLKEE